MNIMKTIMLGLSLFCSIITIADITAYLIRKEIPEILSHKYYLLTCIFWSIFYYLNL